MEPRYVRTLLCRTLMCRCVRVIPEVIMNPYKKMTTTQAVQQFAWFCNVEENVDSTVRSALPSEEPGLVNSS